MKTNPSRNTYYWRAIRRIAKRYGISITKARKRDWEKEARAEHKRRSAAHRKTKPKRKPVAKKPIAVKKKKKMAIPTRKPRYTGGGDAEPQRELKIREYRAIVLQDEDEIEADYEYGQEWESDWEDDYPELDDMDDLDGFLQDFDHEDSDKYQEPA
jgi:hypothetical protein